MAPTQTAIRLTGSSASRHLTLLFSEVTGLTELSQREGDVEASRLARRLLTLQEIVATRDGVGQVVQVGVDSLYAVFDNASAALNRALEIQRIVEGSRKEPKEINRLQVRIGLHTGEVLVREGEHLEVIGRHVTRGRRVMEIAAPGQILASEEVTNAARDLVDIPKEVLAIEYYGEFYLKGAGATALCEVADLRVRRPSAPRIPEGRPLESALVGRLELAGYRPLARLGEGSFGVVYQAEQLGTGRTVAVKVLSPVLAEHAGPRQRFKAEVGRVRSIGSPGVASVLDERLDHRPPFFVMELVHGKPVDAALEGASSERIARVFASIGRVLEEAHAAGVVHCDLKPGNVLIRADDTPVILDFGVSMLEGERQPGRTSSTTFVGTPAYAAPERIRGQAGTSRTDVYCLGVLLFKVLTGREPFTGDSIHEVVEAHLHEDPPLPGMIRAEVPDGLQRICLKALEKHPEDRYAGVQRMTADLVRFVRGELIRTRPSTYDNLLYHRVRQHVGQIEDWTRRGLLNCEEHNRLLSAYEGLLRRGLPAVMEGRQYRFWQTLVYLGGWAILNGVLFWLIQFWAEMGRGAKLALGAIPALTAFALALGMWKLERFRLTFVALIVAILAVPLFAGVWLHEFEIAKAVPAGWEAYELFPNETRPDPSQSVIDDRTGVDAGEGQTPNGRAGNGQSGSYPVTNRQLGLSGLLALLAAMGVMGFTRTTTHSTQAFLVAFCCYSIGLLWWGLRPNVLEDDWAQVGFKYVPFLILGGVVAWGLLRVPERRGQAGPWHYGTAFLLVGVFYAIGLDLLEELDWADLDHAGTYLLLAGFGVVEVWIGLVARRRLEHRSRGATWFLIFIGLVNVLAGLGIAGWEDKWPAGWWSFEVFSGADRAVPLTHLLLPGVSVLITLLACRFQLLSFLILGLIGFAMSVHLLGFYYFPEVQAWPKWMIGFGALSLGVALGFELRRTRGNTLDDLVSRSRL